MTVLVSLVLFLAAGATYELNGRLSPETRASVSLHGAVSPFNISTMTDTQGKFHFRHLDPGTYTVIVFVPGRGEARQTVEVGPGTADAKRRVSVTLPLPDAKFAPDTLRRQHSVSARELSIPDEARREYEEAQKHLSRREVPEAVDRLEKAVELAPQFSAAWNNLGTIAYQTGAFAKAETCFRKSLEADPGAYEPLVNLGGVLLTLNRPDEALPFNLYAVLSRPNDALANSQMGMNYFQLGDLDLAGKYLRRAVQLDPTHFSHPQLLLAEIHLRRGEFSKAAAVLEDFLIRHPDWKAAEEIRAQIERLRAAAASPQ